MTRGGTRISRQPSLLLRRDEGAAAVEFALISLLLFTLIFGIIEFGFWLSQNQVYQSAAREGARKAALGQSTAVIQSTIQSAASPYAVTFNSFSVSDCGTDGSSCSPSSCTNSNIGNLIKVQWTQTFSSARLFALLPVLPTTKVIQGTFRCEGVPS